MRTLDRGRLKAWVVLVAVLAAFGYASRASGGKPPKDAAYQWSTAAAGVIQYGIILAIVLAITRPDWSLLALRRPRFLIRVSAAVVLVFVAVYGTSAVVAAYSDPGREQGLTPDHWDSHRAAQFAVNFVVFVAVAPAVEELTFRGLGYSLLEPLGRVTAVLWIGVAFGLAHGLVEGLPILIVFGAGLAVIRAQSKSVYPGMIVHGLFNAIALIVSVAT
jgi:membrane protease YdiL (CAAX protease family)